jgi:Sec-independent protein translocase protein TatA
MKRSFLPFFSVLWALHSALAFVPRSLSIRQCTGAAFQPSIQHIHAGQASTPFQNVAWRSKLSYRYYNPKQRLGTRQTQLMGVFGLGAVELLIIVVATAFILGPEKIVALLRSSGETANEFKEELSKVPDEFKKGMEEGEVDARSRKAKKIRVVSRSESGEEKED